MEQKRTPSFLSWAVALAIVIISNLFFYYAIATVYHEPKFDDFCPIQNQQYTTPEQCVTAGGQWSQYQFAPKEITEAVKANQPLGYCDPNFTCQKTYDSAHSIYNRNVFLALIIISIIVIGVGLFITIDVLSLGFTWAGVVSLLIASIRYWSDANNVSKLIILALALAALVWLAVKRMRVRPAAK
jgi:hypothetical protein